MCTVDRRTPLAQNERSAAFVASEVTKGRYPSANEVVIAGLRLLEERERDLAASRTALTDGENSGEATPFDFDGFIAGKRAHDAGIR